MPIKTGHYFIINVQTKNQAYLPNPDSAEPIQSRYHQDDRGEQWEVRDRKNGHHSVINVRHGQYAASGIRSAAGDLVIGWERDQTWHIQKTGVKGQYIISTTDSKRCWGLTDSEQGTPIALADVPTDPRNWWMFKDVETRRDAEVNPIYETAAGNMIPHAYQGLNSRQILSQSPYVVHGAIHDSGQRYPPSECHPDTRKDILNIARDWVNKPLDESESQIFWLSGPAGVGKTAIAQSLCQLLKELGRLGGDFFLSRSVAGHSDLHTLFPTLVYQLAEAYPEFGDDVDAVIEAKPSILTKNMVLQIEQLIVNPLKRMNNILNIPLILVIDGLDEGGGESDQSLLLQLLGFNFLSHHLPLKIVLTSRPEPWIKSAFSDTPLVGSSRCHFLHHTSQTDNDIRTVLNSGFAKIKKTHDLMKMKSLSDRWPSSYVINDLVDKASGQFVYASTILKYVGDPNGNPTERLQQIIKMSSKGKNKSTDSPFLALDNLYMHVLSTSSDINRTLTILGIIISGFIRLEHPYLNLRISDVPLSLNRIERILEFGHGDCFLALRTIQSLVDISSNDQHGVEFFHKSFQDFLLDPNRSGKYFVDINQAFSKLMLWPLRLLRDFERSENRWQNFREDLDLIRRQWMAWWLRAAASDEDELLAEIRATDRIGYYFHYIKYLAIKLPPFRSWIYPEDMKSFINIHCNGGNIAELISVSVDRRTRGALTFTLSLERFLAVEEVLYARFRMV